MCQTGRGLAVIVCKPFFFFLMMLLKINVMFSIDSFITQQLFHICCQKKKTERKNLIFSGLPYSAPLSQSVHIHVCSPKEKFLLQVFFFFTNHHCCLFSPMILSKALKVFVFLRKKKKFEFILNFLFLNRNRKVGFCENKKKTIKKICF